MSTYLSVDLDYWGGGKRRACTRFIRQVLGLGVPVLVVLNHDELLSHVDRSGCNRIEHVDYHSDVGDYPADPSPDNPLLDRFAGHELYCDEGTWLSFVRWRKKGELLWRMPSWECYRKRKGTCHSERDPFKVDCSEWRATSLKLGIRGIPWDDVARVGISVSYDYWTFKHDRYMLEGRAPDTYRSVLPGLLGTSTYDEAVQMAKRGQLSEKGRRAA